MRLNDSADLPYLVRFGVVSVALQVWPIGNAFPSKYVMAAPYSL